MTLLRATTLVHAPAQIVFDLARDVHEHNAGLAHTGERAVAPGRVDGRLDVGDLVCFRGRHFGVWLALDARIVALDPPRSFTDEQVRGPFRSLRHRHLFVETGAGTLMTDELTWTSPVGPLGWLADEVAVRQRMLTLLTTRNAHLKRRAELTATREAATREDLAARSLHNRPRTAGVKPPGG